MWNDWNEERKPTWRFHSANRAAGRRKRTAANTMPLLVAAPLGLEQKLNMILCVFQVSWVWDAVIASDKGPGISMPEIV